MCLDRTNLATTINHRLQQTITWVNRLRWMALTHQQKVITIHTVILPAALYGSEVGHCSAKLLKALQSAIANAVGPTSARRSVELVLEMVAAHREIDPQVHLLSRKLALLYRVLHKYPDLKVKVVALLSAYETLHHKGTTRWGGLDGEDVHKHNFGPISHLLLNLHAAGATITTDLTIHQPHEPGHPLLHVPRQLVKPLGDTNGPTRKIHTDAHQASPHHPHTTP